MPVIIALFHLEGGGGGALGFPLTHFYSPYNNFPPLQEIKNLNNS